LQSWLPSQVNSLKSLDQNHLGLVTLGFHTLRRCVWW
jgi:hypothetical protein